MRTTPKITLAAFALLLLALGVWLVLGERGASDRDEGEGGSAVTAEPAAEALPELASRPEEPERVAAPSEPASTVEDQPTQGIATGVVVDALTRDPIQGARVHAEFERGALSETLRATTTDAEGRFRLDLSAIGQRSHVLLATGSVRLRAHAPGYRPWNWPLPQAEDDPGPLLWDPVEIQLNPGSTAFGRVVDPAGKPVPGAQVSLHTEDTAPASTERTWTNAEGRFRLGVGVAGDYEGKIEYDGRVEEENVGTSVIERFPVGRGVTIDLGDVRLVGPGTISGVLRYPDGTPASYAKAAAWVVPVDEQKGAAQDPVAGLSTTRARADEKGRFELRGLAPGRYYVADAAERPGSAARKRPGDWPIHATGDENVGVAVRGHRVVLRLRDVDGNPVPGAGYSITWKRPGTTDELDEDMSSGTLVDPDGILTLRGKPGERIELNARAGEAAAAEFVVTIRAELWQVLEDLVLRPPPQEKGTLHIAALTDDRGTPIAAGYFSVTTRMTDALVHYNNALPLDGLVPDLPVGAYRLEVTPGRKHSRRWDELWFPVLREFDIEADKRTSVELVARAGSRLRLTVFAEGLKGAPRRQLDRMKSYVVSAGSDEHIRTGAFLTDHKPGHWSTGNPNPGRPGLAWRLFEPGSYALHVELEGYAPFRREIRLDPGAILDVEVRLERD